MSKTETIDEIFHAHKWGTSNYLLSTSHSGDIVLEWLMIINLQNWRLEYDKARSYVLCYQHRKTNKT